VGRVFAITPNKLFLWKRAYGCSEEPEEIIVRYYLGGSGLGGECLVFQSFTVLSVPPLFESALPQCCRYRQIYPENH